MTPKPLRSRNYAPSPALSPYIARHYVLSFDAPGDFELTDTLLAETVFVRLLLRGDWAAEAAPGQWNSFGTAVFCGPNSRPLRVRVRGGFRVIGIALCPAGWRAFTDMPANLYANRIFPISGMWGERAQALLAGVSAVEQDDAEGDARVVAVIEDRMTSLLDARGWPEPDWAMHQFERMARLQSTELVRDLAGELGLSQRSLERKCQASFGMSPKAVLRRSRFLDMAAAMRGLTGPGDADRAALRYYDQPQMIREFRHFIGMTPGQFEKTPTPLLDAGLALRELRKLEDAACRTFDLNPF